MVPAVGLRSVDNNLKEVVFPAPFGPSSPNISPSSTEKEAFSKALTVFLPAPNTLDTSLKRINTEHLQIYKITRNYTIFLLMSLSLLFQNIALFDDLRKQSVV
jgi:hypothetical protein